MTDQPLPVPPRRHRDHAGGYGSGDSGEGVVRSDGTARLRWRLLSVPHQRLGVPGRHARRARPQRRDRTHRVRDVKPGWCAERHEECARVPPICEMRCAPVDLVAIPTGYRMSRTWPGCHGLPVFFHVARYHRAYRWPPKPGKRGGS
jgi:hypothetical protein